MHVQHTFLIVKNNFARFCCTFLCRCSARLQRETYRNVLVTRFMEEMWYVFLFTFFLPPLIFTLVAASISPFSHRRYKIFMFQPNGSPDPVPEVFRDFSSRKRLVVAASRLALDLFREEKSRKTSGTRRRRNARLFEMQNFIPAYMKG